MVSRYIPRLVAMVALISCTETTDARFTNFQEQFRQSFARRFSEPLSGHILNIPLKTKLFADYKYLQKQSLQLGRIEPESLSAANQSAYRKIDDLIEGKKRQLTAYRNDPSIYNVGGELKKVLIRKDWTLPAKMDSISGILVRTESYYEEAMRNIYRPIPGKARIGSQKQMLTLKLLKTDLQDSIEAAPLTPVRKKALLEAGNEARIAIKNYLSYCESLWFESKDSLLVRGGGRKN